jgi:hypothetical protein
LGPEVRFCVHYDPRARLSARRYGDKNMMWYISVCSLIGGISVSVTTGLGSAIVTTAMHQGNQVRGVRPAAGEWES